MRGPEWLRWPGDFGVSAEVLRRDLGRGLNCWADILGVTFEPGLWRNGPIASAR